MKRYLCLTLIVLGIAIRAMFIGPAGCATDFAPFYAGGRLVTSSNLYNPQASFDIQDQTVGCHTDAAVFIKPPFYAAIMWPFAQLPFTTALVIWRVLTILSLIGFVLLFPGDKWLMSVFLAWSIPVLYDFNVGQDVAFLLLFAMAAYRLVEKHPYLSGVVLGLCAIKFHLFLFLPILILEKRLWKLAYGLLTTGTMLAIVSFIVQGWKWPLTYLHALSSQSKIYTVNQSPMLNIIPAFFVVLAIIVALLTWWLIRNNDLRYGFALMPVVGILLTPHWSFSDLLLLTPVIFLLGENNRIRGIALFMTYQILSFNQEGRYWPLWIMSILLLMLMDITVFDFEKPFKILKLNRI